jgi:hypothetical protein
MSQPISDIVKVTIDRTAQPVARTNFGVFMLVDEFDPGSSPPFSGRTKNYFSLSELSGDGYASGDYVYDATAKMFSQNPRVDYVKVGAKFITSTPDASWTAALTAIRNEDSAFYGLSIKSTTLADQKEVADWVQTQTDPRLLFFIRSNDSDIVELAAPSSGYATISNSGSVGSFPPATVPGIASQVDYELDITVDGTLHKLATIDIDITDDWTTIAAAIETSLQAATSSSETCVIDALEKIRVTSATAGEASTIVIAAGTAGTGSGDLLAVIDALGATYTTVLDTPVDGEEDIAYYLENLNYNRSTVFYHPDALTNYIECAAAGERFPKDAAVGTWMFKTLVGIASYDLTGSERQTALAKYANIYIERGSIDMTEEGTVGNGRFLDEERGIDQLEATIQEDVYQLFVDSEKVPHNNDGYGQIQGKIEGALGISSENIINDDYVVTVPDREDTLVADRQARVLKDVTFTATLQGAIHKVEIDGVVSI